MSGKNIYGYLRKFFKFPRPNEIWGDKAKNQWDFWNILLYIKFSIGHLSSWIGFLFGLLQTILLLGIVTKQTNLLFLLIAVVFGSLIMFVGGHILIVLGSMKRESIIAAEQNEPVVKLLQDTQKILDKLNEFPTK